MEVKEFKEVREVKAICFIAKYTKVSDLGRDGLKAQQAHSPGHRPGLRIAIVLTPCQGQKRNKYGAVIEQNLHKD